MLKTLTLLLPALIPSWRFFDEIAPSPRIEYVLLNNANDTPQNWQEFRPRPSYLSSISLLKRIFWNPQWNESLFLMSCAERLMANPTEHSAQEIRARITAELQRHSNTASHMQFRLVFWYRDGAELHQEITYISPVHSCSRDAS